MKGQTVPIEQLLKRAPPSCSCFICQHMCQIPCWGTPIDIQAIIDAGMGNRLSLNMEIRADVVWILVPAYKGYEGKLEPPGWDVPVNGGCTFWNEEKLCDLHEHGLKPLEGVLSHHHPKFHTHPWLRERLIKEWDCEAGVQMVVNWMERYMPDYLAIQRKHGNLP